MPRRAIWSIIGCLMKHYRVNSSAAMVAVLAFSATLSVAGGAEASAGALRAAEGPSVTADSWQSLLACLSEVARQMQGADAAGAAHADASRAGWEQPRVEPTGTQRVEVVRVGHAGDDAGAFHLLDLPPPMH